LPWRGQPRRYRGGWMARKIVGGFSNGCETCGLCKNDFRYLCLHRVVLVRRQRHGSQYADDRQGIGNPAARPAGIAWTLPSLGGVWQAPRARRRGGTGMRLPPRRAPSGFRREPSGSEGWFAWAWVQGGARRLGVATTEGGYHCTSWSKTDSDDGCPRTSQSGTRSTGGSSRVGGPWAGRSGAARRARRYG
jgi:hypothetical protein